VWVDRPSAADGGQALIALSGDAAEALSGAAAGRATAIAGPAGVAAPGVMWITIGGVLYRATVVSASMPLGGGAALVGSGAADVVLVRARLESVAPVLLRPGKH
jgi:hypothetical protein